MIPNQPPSSLSCQFICTDSEHGRRLDQVIAQAWPEFSRSRLQSWIKSGNVTVDQQVVTKQRTEVQTGQTIELNAERDAEINSWQTAQAVFLPILYEDEAIIVINKPAGLVVHPGSGNPDQTLVNGLLHFDPRQKSLPRAGIVHRLDKDTSGVLVVARSLEAHTHLVRQLQGRSLKRQYEALAHGEFIAGGTIDAPIDRHPTHRTKMAVVQHGGREAITHYRVSQRLKGLTLLKVFLETGRTHQIRVHMQSIKHPLVGDPAYSRRQFPAGLSQAQRDALQDFERQALHAKSLTLIHPETEEEMTFTAPRPDDLQQLLDVLTDDS